MFGLAAGLLPCERAGAIDHTKPVPEAKGLTAYLNGANVLVRLSRQTQRPRRLEKRQTLRLRYRVALHAGDPKEAALDRVYEQWIKG